MNPEEIEIIKETWEVPKATPTDSGAAILIRFFTKYPSNLQKFPFRDIPVEDLNNSGRFRAHAGRIIRVFDESIRTFDDENGQTSLVKIWEDIAVSHFKRRISRESYLELRGCILEVLTEACGLNDYQAAVWTKLLDAVYDIIFNKITKMEESGQ